MFALNTSTNDIGKSKIWCVVSLKEISCTHSRIATTCRSWVGQWLAGGQTMKLVTVNNSATVHSSGSTEDLANLKARVRAHFYYESTEVRKVTFCSLAEIEGKFFPPKRMR